MGAFNLINVSSNYGITHHSVIMNSLTEAKEFVKLKVVKRRHKDRPRRYTQIKCPQSKHADIVAVTIPQDNAWPIARDAQVAAKLSTSE